jgi:hypothetical protein
MPSPPPAHEAAAGARLTRYSAQRGAEIDARVAGLPPGEESCDGRMQRDAVELVGREEPMAAYGLVARHDTLERAVQLAGEDDMDDVLRPQTPLRRDRLDDRDRPLDRQLVADRPRARLLRQLALQRVDERLAARHAAPGQQPVLAAALLVADEEDRPAPVQERRDPDARLGAHA